jgi:hypothetical protein
VRARRSGSGVRAGRRVAARTTAIARSTSVLQAAWTATGRAPGRVRSQAPTSSPSSHSGAVAQATSGGRSPLASSGRSVTPTVGRSSTAPRCTARPARYWWSRPVALTSSTSGRTGRLRTAASRSGPSRRASRPGAYGAPATPSAVATATSRRPRGDRRSGHPQVAGRARSRHPSGEAGVAPADDKPPVGRGPRRRPGPPELVLHPSQLLGGRPSQHRRHDAGRGRR